jgi:hypothetical protein
MKVNRPYADTKGDNKISRLGFLRLLGAGAIGYFAYRAGFINNLFASDYFGFTAYFYKPYS